MQSKWTGRTAFAEAAETLGIRTDEIMAMLPLGPAAHVLYTVGEVEDDTVVWAADLLRDEDGVLRLDGLPVSKGTIRDWKENIEELLRKAGEDDD